MKPLAQERNYMNDIIIDLHGAPTIWILSMTNNVLNIMFLCFYAYTFNPTIGVAEAEQLEVQESSRIVIRKILKIEPSGLVIFEKGDSVHLWGLKITDFQLANHFLVGRTVECREVIVDDDKGSYDCDASSKMIDRIRPDIRISLFEWLPDLGIAVPNCGTLDKMPDGILAVKFMNKFVYTCESSVPKRRVVRY